MLSPSLWRVFVRNWRKVFRNYFLPTIPSNMVEARPVEKSTPLSSLETVAADTSSADTGLLDMIEIDGAVQTLHVTTQPPHPNPPQIEEGITTTPPLDWGRFEGSEQLPVHEGEQQDTQPVADLDSISTSKPEADTLDEPPLTVSQQDQLPVQDIQTESTEEIGLLNTAPETPPNGDLLVLLGETWQPLGALIESLLFVADKPVEVSQIARTLSLNVETVEASLRRLADAYQHNGRGLRLQEQQNRWRLVTMPEAASAVEAFLNLDMTTRLSTPALETLSVIAYRQPVTRPQIEAVRGVDCGAVLRSLIQRGLVEEVGRLESVGRPILYSVSEQFMHHFGLLSMRDLPPLEQPEEELLRSTSDLALA